MTVPLLMAATSPSTPSAILVGILPWLLIFVIFYMLMIRPQQRRVKEHQAAIAAIKPSGSGRARLVVNQNLRR